MVSYKRDELRTISLQVDSASCVDVDDAKVDLKGDAADSVTQITIDRPKNALPDIGALRRVVDFASMDLLNLTDAPRLRRVDEICGECDARFTDLFHERDWSGCRKNGGRY